MTSLVKSIATVGGWTMISRILGFVRDVMIANVLGAGMIADAFFIAFKFPNLFRRLFGEGAMNAAFVPMYAGRLESRGRDTATAFAADVAAVLTAWSLFLTLALMAAMPWVMTVTAHGFVDQPEKFDLTVELARITFPYLLFMVLAALLSGMLNSVGRFAAAAAAPVILNLVFISALMLIHFGHAVLPGQTLAYAVAVSGALQFLMLVAACRREGVMPPLPWPKLTPDVKRLLVLMAPGVLGAGVVQINVVVGDMLATLLQEGSVSFLYYADRVNQLPLGVVGTAVGIALLPLLSRQLRAGDIAAATDSMNRALEVSMILTVPAAVALVAMPEAIVTVLFQRGAFGADATDATSGALRAFALGLPAYVLIKALAPGFFAREDTSTPVKIAIAAMAVNLVLAIGLMQVLDHVGIALATALAAWINAGLLASILARRGLFAVDARLRRAMPRLMLSAAVMGGTVYFAAGRAQPLIEDGELVRGVVLAGLIAGGMAVYAVMAQITGAADFRDLRRMLKRPAKSKS
ncbi:MAG: murein biosynthesis integral membrane protein MurJ [Alphaproteobacteria bacterium]